MLRPGTRRFFVDFRRRCRLFGEESDPKREDDMDISLFPAPLKGKMAARYKDFLSICGLRDEADADVIALMQSNYNRKYLLNIYE